MCFLTIVCLYFSFLRSASILLSLSIHTGWSHSFAAKDQSRPSLSYPWIMDCAKSGRRGSHNGPSPKEGTILNALLSCMVESSVVDGFTDKELTFRSTDLDWCFPPSFLSVSSTCHSERFDPYRFLFPCLGMDGFPDLDNITFYYELPTNDKKGENTTRGSFANDTVIVIDSLIDLLCSFLDSIRSPGGVMCLTDICQTVTGSPSTIPSDQPSEIPSDQPSMTPSIAPSIWPSQTPTDRAKVTASSAPSILSEVDGSGELVPPPTKRPISLDTLPSLAVQVEILIRFDITGVRTEESLHSGPFMETLQVSLDKTFDAKVRGHKSVDVVMMNQTIATTVETIIRAIGRRECRKCSAPSVANLIVSDYLDELRNADVSGGLNHQIEFQAFIRDFELPLNIAIDSESVGLLASSNSTGTRSQFSEASSATTWAVLSSRLLTFVLSVIIFSAVGN